MMLVATLTRPGVLINSFRLKNIPVGEDTDQGDRLKNIPVGEDTDQG